jgi:ABC-2 type transport system permease protein
MNATWELIRIETKLYLREPVAVFFSMVFPFLPLLVFGTLFGRGPAMPGFRVIDVYVPALIAMVVAYLGLMGLPIALSEYREQGVLKRYRASPLSLGRFFAAHLAVQFVLLLLVSAAVTWVADLAFGLRFVGNLALVLAVIVIGTVSLFAVGFALVGLCNSSRTTQTVGSVLFFLMLFTSGAAVPRRQFPPWLKELTDWVPLSHLVDTLTAAWVGDPLAGHYHSIAILLGIAAVAFPVARKTFRWDP